MKRTSMRCGLLILLILPGVAGAAESSAAVFDVAKTAYDAGRFQEARSAYESLLERESVSAELLFNLGNACYRMNDLGHAALYYRRASQMHPRDPDIRANAALVQHAAGASLTEWQGLRWVRILSAAEWLHIGWIGYGLGFAVLSVLAVVRSFRKPGRILFLICMVLAGVGAAGWGGWKWVDLAPEQVVVDPLGVDARFAPLPDAQIHFHLPVASVVRQRGRTGDWRQVQMNETTGWIPAASTVPVSD